MPRKELAKLRVEGMFVYSYTVQCTMYILKFNLTHISTGVCGGADRGTVQLSEGVEIY